MDQKAAYENYPCWIMAVSNIVSLALYFSGAFILYHLGIIWLILYIAYILWLETKVMRKSCTKCYYYGKSCAFGKGKLAAVFFRRADSKASHPVKITWVDIVPDFMASIIPVIVGIVLMIIDFSWILLSLVILIALLTTAGNSYVRGSLACKHCKQRQIGCPAEQLFAKARN